MTTENRNAEQAAVESGEWPPTLYGDYDFSEAEYDTIHQHSRRVWGTCFGGIETCSTRHEWLAKPSRDTYGDYWDSTIAEGFCPLCPGTRLGSARVTGRDGEPYGRCPCCDKHYRLEQHPDGLHVITTGGNQTVSFWRDDFTPEAVA